MKTRTVEGDRAKFRLDHPLRQSLETLLPALRYGLRHGPVEVQNDPYDAETRVRVRSLDAAWDEIASVDESILHIGSDWFLVILDNGPDCISDYRDTQSAALIASLVE